MRVGLVIAAILWATAHAADVPPCCRTAIALGEPTDQSIYLLDSTWTSDVGKPIKLGVLRGRPQVVALFFTHCEYACPITVENMKRIERSLPEDIREGVDFLLISMDTERDTPEVMREYRARKQLATKHWTLVRGEQDDVRELAALFGINYRKDARGQFAHSNVITLLNAEGEVVHQQLGLSPPPQLMLDAIARCIRGTRP